jgi:hypothetical protein
VVIDYTLYTAKLYGPGLQLSLFYPCNHWGHTQNICRSRTNCGTALKATAPKKALTAQTQPRPKCCNHPTWGGPQSGADDLAEDLLSITATFGLELLLPRGEIPWQRGRAATTIDLIFASAELRDRLIEYSAQPEWAASPRPHNKPKHYGPQSQKAQ